MRYSWMLLLGAVLLALGACGGGGGGVEPGLPPDLTGWWQLDRNGGDGHGYEPTRLLPLADDGSIVLYLGTELRKEGWTLRAEIPDAAAPDRSEYRFDVASASLLDGDVTHFRADSAVFGVLERLTAAAPPVGTLVINGSVHGRALAVDATTAHAAELDDRGLSTQITIYDTRTDGYDALMLKTTTTPPIPVGTWDVGGADHEISVRARSFRSPIPCLPDGFGVGGAVVLTESSRTRVAGWYIVDLGGGESIAGSFDTPIRVTVRRD